MIETIIALSIAVVSLVGVSALMLASGKHYRDSAAMTDMYDYSRIAVDRLSKDLSETSAITIMVRTTDVRPAEGLRDDAISFASARDEDGVFQVETYGAFNFTRPSWQKVIVYYLLHDYNEPVGGGNYSKNLYRKEIIRTNWDDNYDPTMVMDEDGEVIAWNVDYMYFGPPYPEVDPEITRQIQILDVSLGFLRTQGQMEAGPARAMEFSTGIPMMNGDK